MEKIIEFFKGDLAIAILISLWFLVEAWLGKTDKVKAGSTLEAVLLFIKKLLEIFGIKKKAQETIAPKDK